MGTKTAAAICNLTVSAARFIGFGGVGSALIAQRFWLIAQRCSIRSVAG
jgi:hypothetical protein